MQTSRTSRRWPALLLAGALLAGCSGLAVAGAPWRAGEPASRPIPAPPLEATAARTRAEAILAKLGLPGRAVTTTRVEDRFEQRVVDRVSFQDANGPSALVELEPGGRPQLVIALGWRGSKGRAVARDIALRQAVAHARAVGFEVTGSPTVLETADEWEVVWERQVDGVPVLGDGVRVSLWKDGTFHAIARWEHPLAPRPTTTIGADTARQMAADHFAERLGRRGAITIESARLAWVRPNDLWDPSLPDAPLPTAHLAWIVGGKPNGNLAASVRRLEVWLDAGDGSVIGGDVIE